VKPRQERHARKDRGRANGRYGQPLVSREPGKLSFDPAQNWLTEARLGPDKREANC
jgi:hypothetical protein